MRRALLPLALAPLALSTACVQVEVHPEFDTLAASHETIAALPPTVDHQRRRLPRGMTPADVAADEQATADRLHPVIVRRADAIRDPDVPDVQRAAATRDRLEAADLPLDAVHALPADELARLLGVDAVVVTDVRTRRLMADGVAALVEFLGDTNDTDRPVPTHEVDVYMALVDADTGETLWTCFHGAQLELGDHRDLETARLVGACARALPYR